MRLLNTETQELKFFLERGRPRYAILSHTWEDDEVLFADIVNQNQDWRQKAGAEKVLGSCRLAKEQGYEHIWIDTCCIDKTSSAELSEAINSMFNWYMDADVCYVYLIDVAKNGSVAECRWFKRGWTLQELIAPTYVSFYDKQWRLINDKISISSELARITGIDESLLRCGHSLNPPLLEDHRLQEAFEEHSETSHPGCSCGRPSFVSRLTQLGEYCVAQKMSWASRRETTRGEDIAYCLMGIFGINMPLLYGEGSSKAFFRLQREILEATHDQSILAIDSLPNSRQESALASHPKQFADSGVIDFKPPSARKGMEKESIYHNMTTALNTNGVSVDLLVVPVVNSHAIFAILDFQIGKNPLGRPAIPLYPVSSSATTPISCRRGGGLYEISPDHADYARDLRVLNGRSDLISCPDIRIQMKVIKRQKLMVLNDLDHSSDRVYRQSIPFRINCIGNSPGCEPYSVESQIPGYAILKKPGYPRLLIHTFETFMADVWSSGIWILEEIRFEHGFEPDDKKDAGQILAKLEQDYRIYDEDLMGLGTENVKGLFPGSKALKVRGSSMLKVKVSVQMADFLDWTMPEVTVHTAEVNLQKYLKYKRQP